MPIGQDGRVASEVEALVLLRSAEALARIAEVGGRVVTLAWPDLVLMPITERVKRSIRAAMRAAEGPAGPEPTPETR